jgi:uracil-DNA glycosylase
MTKQEILNQIKADILKNDICPDLAKTATNLVFGDGDPQAEIVFIGEAPGKNEDEQGLPFVGAAGKFLDEMLKSVNLNRNQVYITNIVKYRPPNNRDPLPEEKQAFLPYLMRQIQTINPKIIITLGRHSMECFLPGMQISKIHGQPKRIRINLDRDEQASNTPQAKSDQRSVPLVVLPLFHPAAALYNGGMRQTLIDDFQTIPEILNLIRQGK